MELTTNEITALKACLNYETRKSQLADNMSVGGVSEFKEVLGWNEKQVGGLITSLEQKGMGFMDEEDDIFWLTEDGVNAIFDIIEKEGL